MHLSADRDESVFLRCYTKGVISGALFRAGYFASTHVQLHYRCSREWGNAAPKIKELDESERGQGQVNIRPAEIDLRD